MPSHFSDEFINSYLDDELDLAEQEELLDALRLDEALAARVCRFKNVKDMVQLAYQTETLSIDSHKYTFQTRFLGSAMAASVLFIGVLLGWFANNTLSHPPSLLELAKSAQLPHQPAFYEQENWRLMLHVSSNDPKRYNIIINETEALLKSSLAKNENIQIELLTNGLGLSLLKNDDNDFSIKLNELAQRYPNLKLLACEKALQRLQLEKGINLKLIPEAGTVVSALHHVIQRQKQGWSYINI